MTGESKVNTSRRRSIVFVFVDGLGIGPDDQVLNPLSCFNPRVLKLFEDSLGPFPNEGICFPTDARLGVDGLPQSATGQTALFTGVNAPGIVGRHLQGYPIGELRDLISNQSLFKLLQDVGLKVTFANTYTPRFFESRPRWISATTLMCETSSVKLRTMEDLRDRRGLFMDFTNKVLIGMDLEVTQISPGEAAEVLVKISEEYDLVLYEYFLTDYVGHRGTLEEASTLLQELDHFLYHVTELLDFERVSLIICSDHGNVEDFSTKLHTLNPVPTLLWGPLQQTFTSMNEPLNLTHITPLLVTYLRNT